MYLLHRYQVEAAAKSLGGLHCSPAVKGDGQVVTKLIAPAKQWRALDALLVTVSPEALALPEKLIAQIECRKKQERQAALSCCVTFLFTKPTLW